MLMFCKVGKDRTGLLAALIAAACDASDEDLLTDYHRRVRLQHRCIFSLLLVMLWPNFLVSIQAVAPG